MTFRITLLGCLLLLVCTSLSAEDRYQRWLEREVVWIASRRETSAFRQLTTDAEKEAFIGRFWARRDPTPGTPRNEYKEEHYRRLEYARKNFREGVPGWKTDRGRIYIIHGPPDRVENMIPDRIGDQETIIWTYFQIPGARYYKGRLVVVFKAQIGTTIQDVTLGESSTGQRAARVNRARGGVPQTDLVRNAIRYRLVAAGPPAAINNRGLDVPASGIGEYAHYVEDLLLSPGELLEERDREQHRQEDSRRELRQQIETRVSYDALPVSMSVHQFHLQDESLISLAWQVPLSALKFEKTEDLRHATLDLIAQIRRPDGELVDEFFKSLDLVYTREEFKRLSTESYYYLNHFQVDPGQYLVNSVVRDVGSATLGTTSAEVHASPLTEGEVTLSDIVMSRALTSASETSSGDELILEEWKIIPEADSKFSKQDQLVLFFKIYNAQPSAEGEPEVVVTYRFLQGDQVIKTSGPRFIRQFTDTEAGTISFGTVVDLETFLPGDYKLQVNAIDYQTKKFAFQREDFRIAP